MCIALIPVYYAKADEQASISISSASGTVGSTITVTVTISASDVIDAASVPVSYDNSIIKPVGAGNTGVVSFALLDASAYGSNESISMQFEVIAAGTTTLSVAGEAKISVNGERATVSSSSSGKVTGRAPASYSSDNTLKSLQISPGTLSPAFSPDRTTYNATVDADVTELVVSAAANDNAAKISISGRRMDPGSNTTTITVTAEDGSVKKYIIYIFVILINYFLVDLIVKTFIGMNITFITLIQRGIICLVIPNVIIYMLFRKSEDFKYIISIINRIKSHFLERRRVS